MLLLISSHFGQYMLRHSGQSPSFSECIYPDRLGDLFKVTQLPGAQGGSLLVLRVFPVCAVAFCCLKQNEKQRITLGTILAWLYLA